MNNFEMGASAPEFMAPESQLIVPVDAGLLAIRGAIKETFRMANSYVRRHQHLIGYSDHGADLRIMHADQSTHDYTWLSLDPMTEKVQMAEIGIDRGTIAMNGYRKTDIYSLLRNTSNDVLVYDKGGKYEVSLVSKDTQSNEVVFSKGIGPKRQDRAAKILMILQDRIRRLDETR